MTDNNFSEVASFLLEQRYYLRNCKGELLENSWEQICLRVAEHFADGNQERKARFYDLLKSKTIVPNTPAWFNAGTEMSQTSACYILPPVKDSMEAIMEYCKKIAKILQSGAGVGINLELLRGRGEIIRSTGGESSGSISWLKIYNEIVESVKGGSRRRGAAMAIQKIDHPDIEEFITCKEEDGTISNFNLSIAITDKFMEAAKENKDWPLISRVDGTVVKTLKAKELLGKIIESAHATGDPGLFFVDTANKYNKAANYDKIYGCNPCLTDDNEFLTPDGKKRLKELKIGDTIWSGSKYVNLVNIISRGKKTVYEYSTDSGLSLRCTDNHNIFSNVGKQEIKKATSILVAPSPEKAEEIGNTKLIVSITGVTLLGELEVFDFTVDDPEHKAWVNGLSVSNCGEVPTLPYSSCNLTAPNLTKFLDDEYTCGINLSELRSVVIDLVKFLNTGIDKNRYPLIEFEEVSRNQLREIGIGLLGLPEVLYHKNLIYGSKESLDFCEAIWAYIQLCAIKASCQQAETRGETYKAFNINTYLKNSSTFNLTQSDIDKYQKILSFDFKYLLESTHLLLSTTGILNAAVTSIAPNGVTQRFGGLDGGGLEPFNPISMTMNIMDKNTNKLSEFKVVNKIFKKLMDDISLSKSTQDSINKIIEVDFEGSVILAYAAGKVPELKPIDHRIKFLRTCIDVTPLEHVAMQAAFQKNTCLACSKTVLLPEEASIDDVREVYIEAHKANLKGVTIYRNNSKKNQVMGTGKPSEKKRELKVTTTSWERPDVLISKTHRVKTGLGTIYLTVGVDDNDIVKEIFTNGCKEGTSLNAKLAALTRVMSTSLQYGTPLRDLIRQLKGIKGDTMVFNKEYGKLYSVPDMIAKVLEKTYLEEHERAELAKEAEVAEERSGLESGVCPCCKMGVIERSAGCRKCSHCSYEEC